MTEKEKLKERLEILVLAHKMQDKLERIAFAVEKVDVYFFANGVVWRETLAQCYERERDRLFQFKNEVEAILQEEMTI